MIDLHYAGRPNGQKIAIMSPRALTDPPRLSLVSM